mgnify:CR=1 FL=1
MVAVVAGIQDREIKNRVFSRVVVVVKNITAAAVVVGKVITILPAWVEEQDAVLATKINIVVAVVDS